MNTKQRQAVASFLSIVVASLSVGCAAPLAGDEPAKPAEVTRKALGPNLWLETRGKKRRVIVGATVCLREGAYGLECLLCRKGTKEHESILTTDAKAQFIHAALLVAGAKAGSPVQFDPQFKSPTGDRVKVTLSYQDKGKTVTAPAQHWIRNGKTKKHLGHGWVFAGSVLFQREDGEDKPRVYAADMEGGYISISNVPSAMLDLPVNSPKSLEGRIYEPFTERIPPIGTKVEIILEPVANAKEK
jgi:hypothetical protein